MGGGDSKPLSVTSNTKRKSWVNFSIVNGPESPSEGKAALDPGHSANPAEFKGLWEEKGLWWKVEKFPKPHVSKSLEHSNLAVGYPFPGLSPTTG